MTPPYNLSILKDNAGGDDDFVHEVIEMFKDSSQSNLEILKNNCIDGPCHDWVEAAHSLKGGAAMLGAEALRQKAADAQNAADVSAAERQEMYNTLEQLRRDLCETLIADGLIQA